MKNKKKIFSLCALVLAAFTVCAIFAACGDPSVKKLEGLKLPDISGKRMAVVVQKGEKTYDVYTVVLDGKLSVNSKALEVLVYLQNTQNLHLKYSTSAYGAYVEEIGSLVNDNAAGTYIMFYTSVAKDFDVSASVETFDCGGVTVKTGALSVSDMSVEFGCVLYVSTVKF